MQITQERLDDLTADLNGDLHAVNFIVGLFTSLHLYDDLIDQDKQLTHQEIHEVFEFLLVGIHFNPFFNAYKTTFLPLIQNCIINWKTANAIEKEGANYISHGIRSSYADLLGMAIMLKHNDSQKASEIMHRYRMKWQFETEKNYLYALTQENRHD